MNLRSPLLIDASEFLNALYEDLSQINDILTLKDPTLLLEGACLFYKGFLLSTTLSVDYLRPLLSLANIYDLFEKTQVSQEAFIEAIYFERTEEDEREWKGVVDEEYMRRVLIKETYMKYQSAGAAEVAEEDKSNATAKTG